MKQTEYVKQQVRSHKVLSAGTQTLRRPSVYWLGINSVSLAVSPFLSTHSTCISSGVINSAETFSCPCLVQHEALYGESISVGLMFEESGNRLTNTLLLSFTRLLP